MVRRKEPEFTVEEAGDSYPPSPPVGVQETL
jgi:hypothetical protein